MQKQERVNSVTDNNYLSTLIFIFTARRYANNLKLNRSKSQEIVFMESRSLRIGLSTTSTYRHSACDVSEDTGCHSDKIICQLANMCGKSHVEACNQCTHLEYCGVMVVCPQKVFKCCRRRQVDIRLTCMVGLYHTIR